MAVRQDTAKTVVIVDGKQGINELGKLEMKANELRQELKGMKKSSDEYIAGQKKLKGLNKDIESHRQKLGVAGMTLAQLVRAQRDYRNQIKHTTTKGTAEYERLRKKYQEVNAEIRKQNSALRGTGTTTKSLTKNLMAMGGAYFGIYQVFTATGNLSRKVAEFQQESANLAAVLGKTRTEIKELTNEAVRLGSTTAFTSSEVVQLQTEFAKLGFSQQEIINLSAATLDLAAATGTELAEAAKVAGATVRGFGLETSETQRVIDVMAKSFTVSALDMEKFSVAMSAVAPVANSAGVSLERTTSLLGLLVDRGLDASTAGTSLRNVFLQLSAQGLTFEEAMAKINTATDKNAVALELFGTRGATTATILASTAGSAEELEKALLNSGGAAEKMAEEQLDTLSGSVTKLSSAWDGFILSLENGEGPIGRSARWVIDLMTNTVNGLKSLQGMLDAQEGQNNARQSTLDVDEFEKYLEKMKEAGFAYKDLEKAASDFLAVDERRLEIMKGMNGDKEQIAILERRIAAVNAYVVNKIAADEGELESEEEKKQRLKKASEEKIKQLEADYLKEVDLLRNKYLQQELTEQQFQDKLKELKLANMLQQKEALLLNGQETAQIQRDINNLLFQVASEKLEGEKQQKVASEKLEGEKQQKVEGEKQQKVEYNEWLRAFNQTILDEIQAEVDAEIAIEAAKEEQLIALQKDSNARKLAAEQEYQAAKANALQTGVSILSDVLGQQTAIGKAMFAFEKALAVASVLSNTAQAVARIQASIGIANAKAIAASPLTAGQPWVGINKAIGAKQIATAKIAGGISIAEIAATTIKGFSSNKKDKKKSSFYHGGDTATAKTGEYDQYGAVSMSGPGFNLHGREIVIPSYERNDPVALNTEAYFAAKNPNFKSNVNPAAVPPLGMTPEQAERLIASNEALYTLISQKQNMQKAYVVLGEFEAKQKELEQARGSSL